MWTPSGQIPVLTRETFLRHLRDGLNHLYDPDFLRSCPLASLLGVAGRYDTPSAIRRILTEAIESLEPPATEPLHSRAWRIYSALLYLYVQRMSQEEAADQMALSSRQLRREQAAGVRALADLLWERYNLGQASPSPAHENASLPAAGAPPTISQELAWLQNSGSGASADLAHILPGILHLAQGLAARHHTGLEADLAPDLPRLAVHPVALRQVLLSLLGYVIPRAAGRSLRLAATAAGGESVIRLCWHAQPGEDDLSPAATEAELAMTRQLLDLCRGRLALGSCGEGHEVSLSLPVLARVPVLVIDDNADTLQLLQRYAAQGRYQLVTTQDPDQALPLAAQHSPQIIVLDVMMPQVDGWEVLARLRQDPLTEHTPIVVCTVLADSDLALSLGAAAFVRKPVTPEAFLAALDRAMTWAGPAPD